MNETEIYLKNLTGKDEAKAAEAASYLIENADLELFKKLVEKTDYLFDFVRNNVNKRIYNAVTSKNFMNIIKFFDCYSAYYDDLFADILSQNANQDLTDDMFELLEKGSDSQKAYAAKYFVYIPDTIALEPLSKYAFSDNENLSYNSAEALGEMQDDVSFDLALGDLTSDDDFERLKAVKFFVAYGRNFPFKELFEALKTSKLKENIAGQIPYMMPLTELLKMTEYKHDVMIVILNILAGLGEILPLCDVFQYELYDVIKNFINENKVKNANSGAIAVILLSALFKFNTFNENQEYTFDETKETKNETVEIFKLLNNCSDEFWANQKQYMLEELIKENDFSLTAFDLIQEFQFVEAESNLKSLLNSNNEIVICDAIMALKRINKLQDVDIAEVSCKIKNENIKALIENI